MAASINSSPVPSGRDLRGQRVVVIGGSSGIGLETAWLARATGANVILSARELDRLHCVGLELAASIAAFAATDSRRLGRSSTHYLCPLTTCRYCQARQAINDLNQYREPETVAPVLGHHLRWFFFRVLRGRSARGCRR